MKRAFLPLFIFLGLAACGGSPIDEGEDYGNILETEGGLILTEEEHEGGWGRAECTLCHNLENIHRENRTGIPLDLEAVQEQASAGGDAGCPDCHGTNGVE